MSSGTILTTIATLAAAMFLLASPGLQGHPEPALGNVCEATVIDVHDGDTCTIEIRTRYKIRLKDCWAPELREEGGEESGEHLRAMIDGKLVTARIGGGPDTWRTRTFGRDVGSIWVGGQDVAERMIADGHAFRTKAELREALTRPPQP